MIKLRAQGALYGGIIGDAIGCTYEFRAPNEISADQVIDIVTPPLDGKFAHDQPLGVWTDDTALTLITLNAITPHLRDLKTRIPSIIAKFREDCSRWYTNGGQFASTGICFDIGIRTATAISDWKPDQLIPSTCDGAQGNGALMRILPCAFAPSVSTAMRLSDILTAQTHNDTVALGCSRMLTAVYFHLLRGKSFKTAKAAGVDALYAYFDDWSVTLDDLDRRLISDHLSSPMLNGDAWCVATLFNCLDIAERHKDIMRGIEEAVRMGGDTDTNASIVGSLLGAKLGLTPDVSNQAAHVIGINFAEQLIDTFMIAAKV